MLRNDETLLRQDTPRVYCDGTKVYKKLAEEYKTHQKGYYILAPSGAGKTYYIESQNEKHWIDGDVLWMATNAHPKGEWWNLPLEKIVEVERRSDVITVEAMKLGFWIIGSDNYELKPDAIVIPDWDTHKKYISKRESGSYDGGATSDQLNRVKKSREWISRHEKNGVPKFTSVQDATNHLEEQYRSRK